MPDSKDFWDKLDILLKPTGGIVAAVSVAIIGYFGSDYLKQKELLDTNSRVFAQIVSQREDADSTLRMNMFNSIIAKFFNNPTDRGEQVLSLELLAYNFHESLDLASLFKHMNQALRGDLQRARGTPAEAENAEFMARLERVAKEVALKQATTLAETGFSAQGTVFFEDLDGSPQGVTVIDKQQLGDRWFKLEVLKQFVEDKELRVKLTAYTRVPSDRPDAPASWSIADATFTMGFFDFPMIDNTRLSDGKRAAVILRDWDERRSAEIQLVYFPGSRASLKEKQYYDELLKDLLSLDRMHRRPPTAELGDER
jgi:hypothetical protein